MADITSDKIGEGLVLAALPAGGYLLAFAFEAGCAYYYGYPIHMIHITLESIFAASAALFVGILIVSWAIDLIFTSPALLRNSRGRRVVIKIALFLALLVITQFQFGLILLAAGLVLILIDVASITATRWRRTAPLDKPTETVTLFEPRGPFRIFHLTFGEKIAEWVEVAIMLAMLAWLAGVADAAATSSYLSVVARPNVFVFRVYDQVAMCGEFDERTREILPVLHILPIENGLELRRKDVGALVPNKDLIRILTISQRDLRRLWTK